MGSKNSFTTSVDFEGSLHSPTGDHVTGVNWPNQVSVTWGFDLETRSWGIKSIDLCLESQEVLVSGTIDSDDDNVDFEVSLNLSEAETNHEYISGEGCVCPDNLYVEVEGDVNSPSSWKCNSYTVTWRRF